MKLEDLIAVSISAGSRAHSTSFDALNDANAAAPGVTSVIVGSPPPDPESIGGSTIFFRGKRNEELDLIL